MNVDDEECIIGVLCMYWVAIQIHLVQYMY